MGDIEVQKHSVHTLVFRSLKRTHDLFVSDQANQPSVDDESEKKKIACKIRDEYALVKDRVEQNKKLQQNQPKSDAYGQQWQDAGTAAATTESQNLAITYGQTGDTPSQTPTTTADQQSKLTIEKLAQSNRALVAIGDQKMIVPKKAPTMPKPAWHPPWKLFRVISGHGGWVRCIDMEPGNEWFVTGSADRVIKIWDLASGTLKLSLTGHISTVRGVVVSPRQPYLFSCAEDKKVMCWDLEYNKVIRNYHGHLSACHSIDLHPTIDVLVTAGRDATCRNEEEEKIYAYKKGFAIKVWDMRTKAQIHCFTGHTNTVAEVRCQAAEPQVVTSSHDATLRLWDLAAGKSRVTLTNHKKSVRALALHPVQYSMVSGSPDNIKQWKFPDGEFVQNLSGHNAIINSIAANQDNVVVSGGDNGSLYFWDWRSGYNFQRMQTAVQPGSLDSEAGIFALKFDKSGSRLFSCEADKTIKIYKEDDTATEETHPINWRPDILKKKRY